MLSLFQEMKGDPRVLLNEITNGYEHNGFLITRTNPVKYSWLSESDNEQDNEPNS